MNEQEPESLQTMNSLDCWDYTIELECLQGSQDLQLAAELGKTLLERNKELESALRQHQNIIDDQTQEIEYLTKQTVALREVNDSRLRIYEQLEVSIQDLERANHRLVLENSAEKKHIKSLTATIEGLENKCEELQTTIDDLRLQVDVLKRRAQRTSPDAQKQIQSPSQTTLSHVSFDYSSNPASPDSTAIHTEEVQCKANTPSKKTDRAQAKTRTPCKIEKEDSDMEADSSMEQISQLLTQLRESRSQCGRDERRITELEEQLSTMVQQNQALENQVIQLTRDEESKSMKYELTHLEEVRQGQMCSRCLRSVDQNSSDLLEDDDSSILDALNNTTSSQQNQHRSSFYMDVQGNKDLQDMLQREMSVVWISPTANIASILYDFLIYVKDTYLIPFLCKPFKIPFILLHYYLRHNKIH